jgi:ubiquinone/menaquinone biosynthesis C-methylase UbiE
VINGLPKILAGEQREYHRFYNNYKKLFESEGLNQNITWMEMGEGGQVREAFSEKWSRKGDMGISEASPFKEFTRNWMLKKYGWGSESGFKRAICDKELILDAGTGLGRDVMYLAEAAKEGLVVGMDFADCAVNALRNVSSFKNAYIIQGDILRMPFKEESFDFILSEGVLHHTPNTQEAFNRCCRVLKTGGEIAFYIYRRKGPIREFADDYLRRIIQKVPIEERWRIAERITKLGKALSELKTKIEVPEDIPELGIKKGNMDVHMFIYWNFLKCFWNEKLPFDENMIVNFDWYVPEYAHRHTKEEIMEWCRENNIEVIWFHEEESGYTVRGIKKGPFQFNSP